VKTEAKVTNNFDKRMCKEMKGRRHHRLFLLGLGIYISLQSVSYWSNWKSSHLLEFSAVADKSQQRRPLLQKYLKNSSASTSRYSPLLNHREETTNNSTIQTTLAFPISPHKKWWEDHVDKCATHFSKWKHKKYGWCIRNKPRMSGLLFAKTFKTGSSTAVGVNLRIAARVGQRSLGGGGAAASQSTTLNATSSVVSSSCKTNYKHLYSLKKEQFTGGRKQASSFLWTVVRHPARRALSSYYFYQVGLNRITPTVESMLQYLEATKHNQVIHLHKSSTSVRIKGGIFESLGGLDRTQLQSTGDEAAAHLVKSRIMKEYDFVAVVERWEESLIVLKLLLDLEHDDMIVFPAKSSGGWNWNWQVSGKGKETCFFIPKVDYTLLPPAVDAYLQTNYSVDNVDYLLHAAANRSLDLTIDFLGRELVQEQVQRHVQLTKLVQKHCQSKVIFPCSEEGVWQPQAETACYWRDMGCGFKCVDEVLTYYKNGKLSLSDL
jgi:hypothetical protein